VVKRIPTLPEGAQDVFDRLKVVHQRWAGIGGLQGIPHGPRGILDESSDLVPTASLVVQLHQSIHIHVVTARLVVQQFKFKSDPKSKGRMFG